jgi:hypothetical protein
MLVQHPTGRWPVDGADDSPARSPAVGSPVTIFVALEACMTPEDVDDFGRQLASSGAATLACDAGRLTNPTVGTVDALARLQLTLRRSGRAMDLRHAPNELRDLLALVGLFDFLPVSVRAGTEGRTRRIGQDPRSG